jgi:hypothetical protein
VTATTTTTIRGVSIFSRQRKRKTDVFDIALSAEGIAIQRPGRSEQHMTWERISEWEIDERPGCVVLTLRGGGSVTPLLVKGWTLQDLETVMREATSGPVQTGAASGGAPEADVVEADVVEADVVEADVVEADVVEATAPTAAAVPRATRRQSSRPRRSGAKVLVTIVLLAVVATAVTVVLLQSAGVIDWAFLGPVA